MDDTREIWTVFVDKSVQGKTKSMDAERCTARIEGGAWNERISVISESRSLVPTIGIDLHQRRSSDLMKG